MATQAEVVELVKNQGLHANEAAERLGITPSGVYGHLRRAGLGRGRNGGRARTPRAIAASPEREPQLPIPAAIGNGRLENIQALLADAVENSQAEIAAKSAEIASLRAEAERYSSALKDLSA